MAELHTLPSPADRAERQPVKPSAPAKPRQRRRQGSAEAKLRKDVIQRAGMLIDDAATVMQRLLAGGEPDPAAASVACMLASKIAALNEARTMAMDPEYGDLEDALRATETREATRIRNRGAL